MAAEPCRVPRPATHCPAGTTGLRAGNSRSSGTGTRGPSAAPFPGAGAAGPGRPPPCRRGTGCRGWRQDSLSKLPWVGAGEATRGIRGHTSVWPQDRGGPGLLC